MRFFYLLIGAIFLSGILNGQDRRLAGADEEIQKMLKGYNAVGASVAIIQDGKIIYSKGFGYRDMEKKLPVTPNTIFPIGSITKSFTSTLVGMLVEENKITLNSKPSVYIPGLQFYNDRMDNLVTVEDLLTHRSGIGPVDGSYLFFPARSRLELAKRLKYIRPVGDVKDSWLYSNFGYAVLGAILEQVTQENWEKTVKERIFQPLEMRRTTTSIADMVKEEDYSFGYGVSKDKPVKVLFGELNNDKPGGSINSTAVEMANWMNLWLSAGSFGGKRIIPEEYVEQATTIRAIYNGAPPDSVRPANYIYGYGYGWNINSYMGHYRVHHGGAVSGFGADIVLFPTDKIGIIVLTNQHNSSLPYIIANMLSNRMLKVGDGKPYSFSPEIHDVVGVGKEIGSINKEKKPTHELKDYVGKYTNPGYGEFEITLEKDGLIANFPGYRLRMEHQYYDIFMLRLIEELPQTVAPEFYLNFMVDNDGEVAAVDIDFQREGVKFNRVKK